MKQLRARGQTLRLNKEVLKQFNAKIKELIKEFAQKIKVKCEDIIRPTGDTMKDGIRGGQKLTRE